MGIECSVKFVVCMQYVYVDVYLIPRAYRI
jgi:hypothetical protein